MGWPFGKDEVFYCSCGQTLGECRLFSHVAKKFRAAGRTFDPRDFGTRFVLSQNLTLNNILTDTLPYLNSNLADSLRDFLIYSIPPLRNRLRNQLECNKLLFESVNEALGATVYVDNSHNPYRALHLSHESTHELYNLHLIRDPRAVVYSMKKNSGIPIVTGTKAWIKRQADIIRISARLPHSIILKYEDLISDTNRSLGTVHSYLNIRHETFCGNFKNTEHHILGNDMRFKDGTIKPDHSWKTSLSKDEVAAINLLLTRTRSKHPGTQLGEIIDSYIQE